MQLIPSSANCGKAGQTHRRTQRAETVSSLDKRDAPAVGRLAVVYFTTNLAVAVRPNTSGEYISSAFKGGKTYSPGVVASAV